MQNASRFLRALEGIDRAAAWLIAVVMLAMVAIVSMQVLYRYGFNRSFDWAEDLARLAFVWAIFLALPLGVKQGAHIGIELVVERLPLRLRRRLFRAMSVFAVALMVTVSWQAAKLTVQQWDEMLPTMDVTSALFMLPVAIGAAHGALHLAVLAVTGRFEGAKAEVE